MGTRALQLLMIVLLTGCVAWASAIFFGPWVLTKYLESQAGNSVQVSGLRITPKLAVTASRLQMLDGGAVVASLRGVEVDWKLFRSDRPIIQISVANGNIAESVSVEDVQVILTQAENGDPIKISGTVARTQDPNSFLAADVKFEAYADYGFQLLRRTTATAGKLTTPHLSGVTAAVAKLEVAQVDLGTHLLQQNLSGTLALTNVTVGGPDLITPDADIKFALTDGVVSLVGGARDLFFEESDVTVAGLTGSLTYNAAFMRLVSPINLALNDFAWKDIRLPAAKAKITPGEEQFKVSIEGTSLGSEITLGRRYIGRTPDASFAAEFDASSLRGNLQISGEARLAADQKPIELEVSFRGTVADVKQPMECTIVACEISDVTHEYNLYVAGETLSGTSRCREPTCLSGARTHDLSTTDTNKFFANLQDANLISPLALGGAYAQMLQGVSVGKGHKINF